MAAANSRSRRNVLRPCGCATSISGWPSPQRGQSRPPDQVLRQTGQILSICANPLREPVERNTAWPQAGFTNPPGFRTRLTRSGPRFALAGRQARERSTALEASEGIEADRAHVQAAILGVVAWARSRLALAAQ